MIRIAAALMLAPLAAPAGGQAPAARDSDFAVTDIRVRLLYEQSGALSQDLTADPDFTAWNIVIGEGSAAENANDLLVTAVIGGPGPHNLEAPLVITVRDGDGKRVATRRIEGLLAERETHRSLLLTDAGCAGTLRVTVELGASRRMEEIALPCGE
jgi:hypothetical protein